MSRSNSANSVMVRIPNDLKAELDELAKLYLEAHEQGRTEVEFCERGEKVWVPLHAVIRKAVKELKDHRERSSRKARTVNP